MKSHYGYERCATRNVKQVRIVPLDYCRISSCLHIYYDDSKLPYRQCVPYSAAACCRRLLHVARFSVEENEVVAYHPPWEGDKWKHLDLTKITTMVIAGGPIDAELVTACRNADVKVLWMALPEAFQVHLIAHESYVHNWIEEQIEVVESNNLDGLHLDIEGVTFGSDHMTALVKRTRERLDIRHPGAHLSFAVYIILRNAWQEGGYDPPAIAPHIDFFVLMAYDMNWGVQPAAPTTPMGELTTRMQDWLGYYKIAPRKMVLALPFYGFNFRCNWTPRDGACTWYGSFSDGSTCSADTGGAGS